MKRRPTQCTTIVGMNLDIFAANWLEIRREKLMDRYIITKNHIYYETISITPRTID